MLVNRVPVQKRLLSRMYTNRVTPFDADWKKSLTKKNQLAIKTNELVVPHLHKLTRPLTSAKLASSWYHEVSAGAPIYLIEYSKYPRGLLSLHAMFLVQLPAALRDPDQEGALKKWVTEASICTTQMGIPTKSIQLLQVQYLDLLMFARKLANEEERLSVASYIDENLPVLIHAHKQEIYELFINEHERANDKKKFLTALQMSFIKDQLKFGIDEVLRQFGRRISSLSVKLFSQLWSMATRKARQNPIGPGESLSDAEHLFFMVLALKHPNLAQREALFKAGEMYLSYLKETEDISKFVREYNKTSPKINIAKE